MTDERIHAWHEIAAHPPPRTWPLGTSADRWREPMIELATLTADDLQTCDWGHCDEDAVKVRLDLDDPSPFDVWLSVCDRHAREDPQPAAETSHDPTKPWPECMRPTGNRRPR